MEALYKEAILCTQGEERAQVLLESIRLRIEDCEDGDKCRDSRWLEYATTQTHLAIYDFQRRAVEVDGRIEKSDLFSDIPFTSQAMQILEALEAHLALLWSKSPEDKGLKFQEAVTHGDAALIELLARDNPQLS